MESPGPTPRTKNIALHGAVRSPQGCNTQLLGVGEDQGPLGPSALARISQVSKPQGAVPRDPHCCPPVALFFGDLRLRERAPGEAVPLSLMESGAEEALPVASLSRIMLS